MLSRYEKLKSLIFYPSKVIEPDWGSYRRKIKLRMVLFPEPLSPIIPTKLPGWILKDKFSMTEAPGEYTNVTLLNDI